MLALIRRAGAGWIAATYHHDGGNADLFGGDWEAVRNYVLRATGAPAPRRSGPALGEGATVVASLVGARTRATQQLLDASEPKHRPGIRSQPRRRRLGEHLIDRPGGQVEPAG